MAGQDREILASRWMSARTGWAILFTFALLPLLVFATVPKQIGNALLPQCETHKAESEWPLKKKKGADGKERLVRVKPLDHSKRCFPFEPTLAHSADVYEHQQRLAAGFETDADAPSARRDGRLHATWAQRASTASSETPSRYAQHVAHRYSYAVAFFGLITASLAGMSIGVFALLRELPWVSARKALLSIGAICVIFFIYERFLTGILHAPTLVGQNDIAKYLGQDQLVNVANQLLPLQARIGFNAFIESFKSMRSTATFFGVGGFVVLAACLGAVLGMGNRRDPVHLQNARDAIDRLLTTAAIVFVAFVILLRTDAQMAYPFITNLNDAQTLGNALVYYWAASASLILLITFGLAFAVHHLNIMACRHLATAPVLLALDRQIKQRDERKTAYDSLLDMLKIFLPLIAGAGFELKDFIGV